MFWGEEGGEREGKMGEGEVGEDEVVMTDGRVQVDEMEDVMLVEMKGVICEGVGRVIRVREGGVEVVMTQVEMWEADEEGSEIVNACLETKMSLKLHQLYIFLFVHSVRVAAFHSQHDTYQYWSVILLHHWH